MPRAAERLPQAGSCAFDEAENATPLSQPRSRAASRLASALEFSGPTERPFCRPQPAKASFMSPPPLGALSCVFLLEHGADYRFANAIGQTPLVARHRLWPARRRHSRMGGGPRDCRHSSMRSLRCRPACSRHTGTLSLFANRLGLMWRRLAA